MKKLILEKIRGNESVSAVSNHCSSEFASPVVTNTGVVNNKDSELSDMDDSNVLNSSFAVFIAENIKRKSHKDKKKIFTSA